MSEKHPIISLTGASGSGREVVCEALQRIFHREHIDGVFIEGESYHRYDRETMKKKVVEAEKNGNANFSHFSPDANLLSELEALFKSYGESGKGRRRCYLHSWEDVERCAKGAAAKNVKPGQFTKWGPLPRNTDLLVYAGLHGAFKSNKIDIGRHADLKIGMTPVINLEWIQKIDRDTRMRGYTEKEVMGIILRRMPDYIRYIIPQFVGSDINIQKVPVVDTSNPIITEDVPTDDECVAVIRFRRPEDFKIDFPLLIRELDGSWMSRRNSIVVPGGSLMLAMDLILAPILRDLMLARH